jgi:uncharacterized membrane-anchored protein
MNRKTNTALFIVGATVGNIVIMIILIIIGFAIVSALLPAKSNPQLASILFLVIFLASIAGSFFIYHKIVQFISKRVDMEKYFHPIFRPRKR